MNKYFSECPFAPLYPSELNQDDIYYMKKAYNQALKAWKIGEVPIGAVIVLEGRIIASAHNLVEQNKDASAHAEMLAITQASNIIGDWRLNEATLYVTKEPCPMCSGACIMSRVGRVVFGSSDKKMGFLGGAININEVKTLNHTLQISPNILEEECTNLIQAFFEMKRAFASENKKIKDTNANT